MEEGYSMDIDRVYIAQVPKEFNKRLFIKNDNGFYVDIFTGETYPIVIDIIKFTQFYRSRKYLTPEELRICVTEINEIFANKNKKVELYRDININLNNMGMKNASGYIVIKPEYHFIKKLDNENYLVCKAIKGSKNLKYKYGIINYRGVVIFPTDHQDPNEDYINSNGEKKLLEDFTNFINNYKLTK